MLQCIRKQKYMSHSVSRHSHYLIVAETEQTFQSRLLLIPNMEYFFQPVRIIHMLDLAGKNWFTLCVLYARFYGNYSTHTSCGVLRSGDARGQLFYVDAHPGLTP